MAKLFKVEPAETEAESVKLGWTAEQRQTMHEMADAMMDGNGILILVACSPEGIEHYEGFSEREMRHGKTSLMTLIGGLEYVKQLAVSTMMDEDENDG